MYTHLHLSPYLRSITHAFIMCVIHSLENHPIKIIFMFIYIPGANRDIQLKNKKKVLLFICRQYFDICALRSLVVLTEEPGVRNVGMVKDTVNFPFLP